MSIDEKVQHGITAYFAGDYQTAIGIWAPLADAGHAEAQVRLGELYYLRLDQFNGPAHDDDDQAKHYFQLAADQDNAEAWHYLGRFHAEHAETLEDFQEAVRCHERSAELGNLAAHRWIAWLKFKGHLGDHDFEDVLEHFRLAAEGGDLQSTFYLGQAYMNGPEDDAEAIKLLRAATSDEGVGLEACELLADLFDEGRADGEDLKEAATYFSRFGIHGPREYLCQARLVHGYNREHEEYAVNSLICALRLDHEDVGPKAIKLLRAIAEKKVVIAQVHMAEAYEKGLGVPADAELSTECLQRAHENGWPIGPELAAAVLEMPEEQKETLQKQIDAIVSADPYDDDPRTMKEILSSITEILENNPTLADGPLEPLPDDDPIAAEWYRASLLDASADVSKEELQNGASLIVVEKVLETLPADYPNAGDLSMDTVEKLHALFLPLLVSGGVAIELPPSRAG